MDEILRLEDLSFRYGEEKVWALKEVSLAVSHGEKIAVLGNNGAGKSTFFRCCNGILRPGEGSLYLKGEKITWRKQEILDLRQTVGLIFQEADHQLIAGTVEEEISFGPMNLKLPEEEVRSRVDASLEAMDLSEYRKRAPHELSGGEKKRVSIADILAMEPELMLLDEPASSLDPVNQGLLEENLEKLHRKGIALVVATHDVDFAWRWAERILIFHQGRLTADADAEDVFEDQGLLDRCGLKRPLLYEVGKRYGISPLPRSLSELPGKGA